MTLFTVDISNHDRDRKGSPLDWAAIRRAGIVATCAKASEGDPLAGNYSYTDPWFRENTDGAARAGIPLIGAYHVLSAGTSAGITRQVNWLRESAPAGAWAMVDVEPFDELKSRSIAPKWVDLRDFCAIWTTLTHGRPLGVYLPQWYWSPAIADGGLGHPDLRALPGNCFLVSSDYGPNASAAPAALYGQRNGDTGRGWAAYGGVVPKLWQFGSQARIPGCSDATDVNAYKGTLDQLTTLLTGGDTMGTLDNPQVDWLYNASSVIGNVAQMSATAGVRGDDGKAGTMQLGLVTTLQKLAVDMAAVKAALTPVDQAKLASDIAAYLVASGANGLTVADHEAVRADVAAVLAGSHIVPS
jgi:hypothetical protein